MLKISQYPRNADGTPMDLEVGVLTDDTGNNGARLSTPPIGPDGAPIDAKALILVDYAGNPLPISPVAGAPMALALFSSASTVSIPVGTNVVQTGGYSVGGTGGALYVFDAAVDAAYVAANPRASFRSLNNRGFRLAEGQRFNIRMFGATGDGVTDDSAAFVGALAYLNLFSTAGFAYGKGVSSLFVPRGIYNMANTTLDLIFTMILEGETSAESGGLSSVLKWNAGHSGIRVQRFDTFGDAGTGGALAQGGDASIIRRLGLIGGFAGVEGEFHAIHARARVTVEDVFCDGWQGDALHLDTRVSGSANLTMATRLSAQGCRNTVYTIGGDSNAGYFEAISGIGNRQANIYESSFLGNSYQMSHGAACARSPYNTGVAIPTSFVHRTGNRYFAIPGQEVWCSTNAPTGAATNNQGWQFHSAGGIDANTGVPDWFNGISVRAGGSVVATGLANSSTFTAPYGEIDTCEIYDQRCLILNPQGSAIRVGSFAGSRSDKLRMLTANSNGIETASDLIVTGDFRARSPSNFIGPDSGATVTDAQTIFGSRNLSHTITFNTYNAAGGVVTHIGDWSWGAGYGSLANTIDGSQTHRLSVAGTTRLEAWNAGVLITGTLGVSGALTASNLSGTNTGDQFSSIAQNTIIGRVAAGAGVASALTTLPSAVFPAFTGDVTTVAGNVANTIAANAVTYAKFQQVAANSLVGNPTGSLANAQGITLAGGLAFSGTTLTAAGALTPTSVASTGVVTSSGGGIGYATGAGGTVAQATNRSTTVVLNKLCGGITLFNTTTAAGQFDKFTLTNSQIAATDVVNVCVKTATANYIACVLSVGAGSCVIGIYTPAAVGAAEAPVINFTVSKAVNA